MARRRPRRFRSARPVVMRPAVDPIAAEIAAVGQAWREARFDCRWFALRDPERAAAAERRMADLERRRAALVAEHRQRAEASHVRAHVREAETVLDDPLDGWRHGGTKS